jgi:predicted Zn-dependent protease
MIHARFADGDSAAQHPVTIYTGAAALTIVAADGQVLDSWPFRSTRLAEEVYRNQPARVIHGDRPGAILRIDDPDDIQELCRQVPGLGSRYLARFGALPRLVFWGTLTLLIVALLVLATPHLAAGSARFVPLSWEHSLGKMVVSGMSAETCTAREGQQALERLADTLAANRVLPAPLHIVVARSEEVNAFAAPGGQIVVLSGLLGEVRTPEEFAGVLAHEIAHVYARHPMAGILRALGLSLAVSALLGDVSSLATLAATVGEHLAVMSYSRGDEAEADSIAVDMLNQANIRGNDFVDFFNQLDDSDQNQTALFGGYLASHPLPRKRAEAIRHRVTGSANAMTVEEWQALRRICSR